MIRHPYIYNQILQIYKALPEISFPLNLKLVLPLIQNCRIITYQHFAKVNNCSINDVMLMCESKTGCTHYDVVNQKYLILWNADSANNNVSGRRRWTQAHEIGHVVLKHLPLVATQKLAENSFNNLASPRFEAEADLFAGFLLCPPPLFELLDISSADEVRHTFGVSCEASRVRWAAYVEWKRSHRKTAWENDMKRLYIARKRYDGTV